MNSLTFILPLRDVKDIYMEALEPKCVNFDYILYGVNSVRLGGHQFKLELVI